MHPGRVRGRTLEGSGQGGRRNGILASLGPAFAKGVQSVHDCVEAAVCGFVETVCSG